MITFCFLFNHKTIMEKLNRNQILNRMVKQTISLLLFNEYKLLKNLIARISLIYQFQILSQQTLALDNLLINQDFYKEIEN